MEEEEEQEKNRQQGGGFFDFLGFGDEEKGTPENIPTAEAPVEENVEVAREDLKTLKDFKEFMKARKVPRIFLPRGQILQYHHSQLITVNTLNVR